MSATGIQIYSILMQILGVLAVACLLFGALGIPNALAPGGAKRLSGFFSGASEPLTWALVIAGAAMLGSLYLSEIVGFEPCRLCWYQRFAMYPLVPLLAVLRFRRAAKLWWLAAAPALVGLGISTLHIWEQANPGASLVACGAGVPCSARYVAVFGFISIPVLAGSAFVAILALMLSARAIDRDAPATA